MHRTISPKQVARAIGASESSVKRWCDRGILPFVKTAGGHRRLTLDAVLNFVRTERRPLVEPDVLGLPASTGKTHRTVDRSAEQFTAALVAGKEEVCRQIIFELYLAGHSVGTILDDIIAGAFQEVGARWCDGEVEVFQERRGCEIATRILHEMRAILVPGPRSGARAMGASPEGDPYSLPTCMVELVLRHAGWDAVSFGCNVPMQSLAAAIKQHRPRIFWLSVSAIADVERFVSDFSQLQAAADNDVAIVVGGRALEESIRTRLNYAVYCDKLQNLERFAATLHET